MTSFLGIRWDEWFAMAMLFVTVGLPIFFLVMSLRRGHLNDPDCSKYEMFNTDEDYNANEMPDLPATCRPRTMQKRPWWNAVNTSWVWVTLGIGVVWAAIMIGAFIASFGFKDLRAALPL